MMKDTHSNIEQLATETIKKIGKSRSPRKRQKLLNMFCDDYLKQIRTTKTLLKTQKEG